MNKALTMRDVIAGGVPCSSKEPSSSLVPLEHALPGTLEHADPRAMTERQVQEFGADLAELVPSPFPAPCRICGAIAMLDTAGLCGVSCNVVAECLRYIGAGRRVRAYMLAKQLRLIELDYPHLVRIRHRKEDRGLPTVYFFAVATRKGLEAIR